MADLADVNAGDVITSARQNDINDYIQDGTHKLNTLSIDVGGVETIDSSRNWSGVIIPFAKGGTTGTTQQTGLDLLTDATNGTATFVLTTDGTNASWSASVGIASVVADTTPKLGGELDCGAHSIGFTQQSATGDGTTTIDWKLGNKHKFTFGAFNETFTFTAPSNPCNIVMVMVQDGTGSRTATWPATVKWAGGTAPTLTTTASGIDIVSFYFDGTNYYGAASLAFA